MMSEAAKFVWQWVQQSLLRPLAFREAAISLALLAVAGTIYCQIYCLLALQQMHGSSMPLLASLGRSSADIVPAFIAFEIGKRAITLPRLLRWLAIAAIFGGALALGVGIRLQVPMMSQSLTIRHMAVDRIPFLLLAAVALAFYAARGGPSKRSEVWAETDQRDQMPPINSIEWVKAAGNYVEIRVAGRTRLLRMTLRQVRALLPNEQFAQIHRSVIVNRQRLLTASSRRRVTMSDGTEFSVGDAYRSNLPRALGR